MEKSREEFKRLAIEALAGMTNREAGELADVSPTTIFQMRHGTPPSRSLLMKIAANLDFPEDVVVALFAAAGHVPPKKGEVPDGRRQLLEEVAAEASRRTAEEMEATLERLFRGPTETGYERFVRGLRALAEETGGSIPISFDLLRAESMTAEQAEETLAVLRRQIETQPDPGPAPASPAWLHAIPTRLQSTLPRSPHLPTFWDYAKQAWETLAPLGYQIPDPFAPVGLARAWVFPTEADAWDEFESWLLDIEKMEGNSRKEKPEYYVKITRNME